MECVSLNNIFRKAGKASVSILSGFLSLEVSHITASYAIETDDTKLFTNARYHTELRYPAKWTEQYGELSGERSLAAFIDPDDAQTSASLVFTPIPADYTRLTSFGGGKETLREYLLPRGEGIEAEVLNEKVKGEIYTLEYVVKSPDNPPRHIISVFALRPQESVVGLTIQTAEDKYESRRHTLDLIAPTLRIDID
jgi:hypothetical protein